MICSSFWLEQFWKSELLIWPKMTCSATARNKNAISLWLHGGILSLTILLSRVPIKFRHPHIVSLKDDNLLLFLSWTTSLFWTSPWYIFISRVTLLPAVSVNTCDCHRGNSVDMLVLLIIRSTVDKGHRFFCFCWQDFYYYAILLNCFFWVIFINMMTGMKTAEGDGCCYRWWGKKFITKVSKRRSGRKTKQQFN